ncbi:hypothetical protein SAMN05216360_12927 [Methylobacterium phyllostachyos]|uniref:Uncharacterized protein n=1 Tax=Methylobacterium phyllostachyos TaxID=582672 RepID=A0A1H0KV11_9HYPH|nr:hypothetical protein [Methylobacterium phyllostachyos]SDO59797.1 hypothetical protein SAMN05216360_12927 [Methylobacterium phyllostachyos]
MLSLKLPNPFRRSNVDSLRDRAANLQADLARIAQPNATQVTAPAPDAAQPSDLVHACNQAMVDWNTIQPRSRAEDWGDEQLDEALDAYGAVFRRAINEPARDVAELQAKARLLLHDLEAHNTTDREESTLTDDVRLTRVILREVAALHNTAALTDLTDWRDPPLGFMAFPAIDPQGFVIIREGLRMELERLHRIALAEYARKVGPDATEATRARVHRELRLDAFEAVAPNGDAEILALGLALDEAHARWRAATPAYWAAQDHVRQACERAKARGGSAHAASIAAWNAPGIAEANDTFDAIGAELERISKAIWRTPARTPLGLAVKARATLVMVFVSGQYERDSHLGEGEDLTEQATRALIEACCMLAGVDWKGQPLGEDAAEGPPRPVVPPVRAWAIEQAAKVNLSGLDILQLHNLYGLFAGAADTWSAATCVPWARQSPESPFHTLTAGGETVEREEQRAAEVRDRIVAEIRTKIPTGSLEHGWRLEILIRHEMLCEGSLQHAPDLRAEIAKAWGG